MDKAHLLNNPMIVWQLNVNKDPLQHRMNDEKLIGPKLSFLSYIGSLSLRYNEYKIILYFYAYDNINWVFS